MNTDDRALADPYCLCCCQPKSRHIAKDLQCPQTVYFIENTPPVVSESARDWIARNYPGAVDTAGADRLVAAFEAGRAASAPPVVSGEAKRPGPLGYTYMGAGGRCDFDQLREAVSEATCGSRDAAPFDPTYYPGHQRVMGINYNSLDRIVTAFVDAATSTPPVVEEGRREAIERDIRIAIWNAGKWQGKPDEVAQSLIRKAMAEPTMIRALSALSTPVAAQGDEVRGQVCDNCGTEWFSTDGKCHLCRRGLPALATLGAPHEG